MILLLQITVPCRFGSPNDDSVFAKRAFLYGTRSDNSSYKLRARSWLSPCEDTYQPISSCRASDSNSCTFPSHRMPNLCEDTLWFASLFSSHYPVGFEGGIQYPAYASSAVLHCDILIDRPGNLHGWLKFVSLPFPDRLDHRSRCLSHYVLLTPYSSADCWLIRIYHCSRREIWVFCLSMEFAQSRFYAVLWKWCVPRS